LKSEFLAEGSVLVFHVAAGNRGLFIHQYSSVLGKLTFSTQSANSRHSLALRNSGHSVDTALEKRGSFLVVVPRIGIKQFSQDRQRRRFSERMYDGNSTAAVG